MATIYLAAADGTNTHLPNGSDAAAGTIGAPKLTLSAAQTAAGIGGTVIADGLFQMTGTNYFTLGAYANQTINSYVKDSATFKIDPASAGTSRVFHMNATSTGLTLGEIVLDGSNKAIACISMEIVNAINSITFNNTKLINYTTNAVAGGVKLRSATGALRMSTASAIAARGFYATPDAASTFSFTGGSCAVFGNTGTFSGYNVTPSVAGCSATVTNVAFSGVGVDTGSGGLSEFFGCYFKGCETFISTGHTFAMSGFSKFASINAPNHATITVNKGVVGNCSGYMNPALTAYGSCYLMKIGDDLAGTVTPNMNGIEIYQNDLSGANHGYLIGCVNGARVWGNRSRQTELGIVSKGSTTGNTIEGNIIEECTVTGLYSKASVGDIITGNTVVLSPGYECVPEYTAWDDVSSTYASNTTFSNNSIYVKSGSTITKLAHATTGNTTGVTFSNNNYFAEDNNIPATAFQFGATSYSLATWISTPIEATALSLDPLFVDVAGGNYKLAAGSPMWRAGKAMFGLKDYRGRKRPIPPSIGAYEPSRGDPVQIARTTRA